MFNWAGDATLLHGRVSWEWPSYDPTRKPRLCALEVRGAGAGSQRNRRLNALPSEWFPEEGLRRFIFCKVVRIAMLLSGFPAFTPRNTYSPSFGNRLKNLDHLL